jgi:glycerophosphoryl diester phosphodiesterase
MRRAARFAFTVIGLAGLVAGCGPTARMRPANAEGARIVTNVAHRGASGHAPEHTLPAYDRALEMGADYIEQDLQLTKDGVLVVLHDATLDRTARGPAGNCKGLVIEKTLAQLATCDVGTWFNERFPDAARGEYVGLRIPTLDEVFARYRDRTSYYIETKNPEAAPGMEEALLRLLDEYGLRQPARDRRQVLIQSFSATSLEKLHALDASLPLIRLYEGDMSSAAIRATLDEAARYAVGIGPAKGSVDRMLIDAAHARCLDVHPYTVNESGEMRVLVEIGVDGMFTNFPDRLDALRGPSAIRGNNASRVASERRSACLARGRRTSPEELATRRRVS